MEWFNEAFGKLVKDMREQRGLSQDSLARLSNLTRVSIANIEAGKFNLSLHNAIEIANHLNFPMSDVTNLYNKQRLHRELDAQPSHVKVELMGILENVQNA